VSKKKWWCVWVRTQDDDGKWGIWEWQASFLFVDDAMDYRKQYDQWRNYQTCVLPEGRTPKEPR